MRNASLDQRDFDHRSAGLFGCFLHAGGNFVGFAVSPADFAVAIANDHHRREAETASPFDHSGAAFDLDDAIEHAIAGAFVFDLPLLAHRRVAVRLALRRPSWIVVRY